MIPRTYTEALANQAASQERKTKRAAKRKLLYSGKPGRKMGRKGLVRAADASVGLYVRAEAAKRNGGICELSHIPHSCGGIQNAFHVFSRAKYAVRWDPRNILATCFSANVRYEHDADFVHQVIEWFKKKNGVEFYDQLLADSNKIAKFTDSDLREIVERFKTLKAPILQARADGEGGGGCAVPLQRMPWRLPSA